MKKITEQDSLYNNLEKMSLIDLLNNINNEDQKVAEAVRKSIKSTSRLVEKITQKVSSGGRLFYIGSGTSGRLGILDASECPPTFGVPNNMVTGLIAGGDKAIKESVESAEDSRIQAWKDLKKHKINTKDIVIGISASGTTPYVVGGLQECQKNKITTGCITCNQGMPILDYSNFPIIVLVGPEFITGSTRMKAGTAQKMILNMLSSSVMIQLGHVIDNKMIDMKIKNIKLQKRGVRMIIDKCHVTESTAIELLKKYGSVRLAIKNILTNEK